MGIQWDDPLPGAPRFRWRHMVTGQTPESIAERRAGLDADPIAQAAMVQIGEVLQRLRELLAAPVHITSGYRGPTRTGSQHDTGHAVDIRVDGMTPLDLLGLIYGWREQSPHPLRQVIAETLQTPSTSLRQPMADKSGRWVHVAIRTGEWARVSRLPWSTSIAPESGSRVYRPWSPT